MRNLILGAASALALASPAVASDLPVTNYSESYARSYEYRTSPPVVVEESAPVVSETLVVRRPVIVACREWWLKTTRSMRRRECMRHLVYMRTRARVGVADGAIDVTSMVVGKVSELADGEGSFTLRAMLWKLARTVRASGWGEPEASSRGAGLGRGFIY